MSVYLKFLLKTEKNFEKKKFFENFENGQKFKFFKIRSKQTNYGLHN